METVCANCGESAASLLACARCHLVRYCGRTCQAQHWKTGHNTCCRIDSVYLQALNDAIKSCDVTRMTAMLSKRDLNKVDEVGFTHMRFIHLITIWNRNFFFGKNYPWPV